MALALALVALSSVEARAGGRGRKAGAAAPAAMTARTARTAIRRSLRDRPPAGLRESDLGKVRVLGTYRKGEGKGVASSTGFIADTTIVAAEFISPSLPLGRRVETFALSPAIGAVEAFSGHPRWHLTLAAARAVAVERAQRDHGPSAFARGVLPAIASIR